VSSRSEYHEAIHGLGFRILGVSGGHLVCEHPTRGIRTHIAATPDGAVSMRRSIGKLRAALTHGAGATDAFLDWLCHDYGVGPDEAKEVRFNLTNEVGRWMATAEVPRRHGGQPPSASAVAQGARTSGRLEILQRAAPTKGALGLWRVSGARYGLDPAPVNGTGHPRPAAVNGAVPPVEDATGPAQLTIDPPTNGRVEAPTPEEYADQLRRMDHPAAPPAPSPAAAYQTPLETVREVAAIIHPMRALLWPDMALREELTRDGLRELADGLDRQISALQDLRRGVAELAALIDENGPTQQGDG